jgi:benzoyl-CoA 2,3-dioxygenase component A
MDPASHVFICGLKGMECGIDEAFRYVCDRVAVAWPTLKASMQATGRFQVETY